VTRTVAAFDFDGTLTRRDTMLPFLAGLAGAARLAGALASAALLFADRDAAKARLVERLVAGRDTRQCSNAGTAYGESARGAFSQPTQCENASCGIRMRVMNGGRLRHTSSLRRRRGARSLDVEHVLCTTLAVGRPGPCTAALEGGKFRQLARKGRSDCARNLGADDVRIVGPTATAAVTARCSPLAQNIPCG
jgi:hypothetical protein